MRPESDCEHHNLQFLRKESSSTTKRYRCLDCGALLYKGKPRNKSNSDFDFPDRELSVYTCAFTKRIPTKMPDGSAEMQRVRVCNNPAEHLCPRKRGHAYCSVHFNPKIPKEEIMRKKIEKERDEQGQRDAEAFNEEARRLREELAGSVEDRKKIGLYREEVEIKEEFASGVILL